MAKIYIDNSTFIDALCQLAESAIHSAVMENGWLIDNGHGDGTMYSPAGQELFNETYDKFEEIINKTLKVYSNEETNDIS